MNRTMTWSELLTGAGLPLPRGERADPPITSVVEDSREARPGSCFVAVRGCQQDGHAFVSHAVQAGATAVVSERPVRLPKPVAALRVPSARGLAGRLAAVLYGIDALQRAGRLRLIGVTGTNGKSTFCYLMRSILERARRPTAMLGTIEYDLVGRKIDARMTTPPAPTLVQYLAEAAEFGASHAVMEVSSHALDQGRCDGLRFDVGVFTNLTGDHLDYHGDMDAYLRAKKRLFDGLGRDNVAVVNLDDPAWARIMADCPARLIGFRIEGAPSSPAALPDRQAQASPGARRRAVGRRLKREAAMPAGEQVLPHVAEWVTARILDARATGTRFELCYERAGHQGRCVIESPLIGLHNVENALAAATAGLGLDVPLEQIVAGLTGTGCIPGRLQRVEPAGAGDTPDDRMGFTVLVDYAHTDDALDNVLSALRPLVHPLGHRLIVLFGCGGDRDRTKRPRMAAVAASGADRVVVTSDNPRTEDPMAIIEDILSGFGEEDHDRVTLEPDRREAIRAALEMARPGDVVLLAGKGHENYQEIHGERLPFDDAEIAAEVLGEIGRRSPVGSVQVRKQA